MQSSEGYIPIDDGVRLFYQKVGSGGPTVLIPNGIYLLDDFTQFAERRTLIFYDVRNRGRSDTIHDPLKLTRGILNDIDDMEAVRRHFEVDRVDLIGHSYMGLMVGLYAMKYPAHVKRVVQIGPMQPYADRQYPPHLKYVDATTGEVFSTLGQMQKDGLTGSPEEICRKFAAVLARLCVFDPADAQKVDWGRCELPNESGFMRYWMGSLVPSIQRLQISAQEAAGVTAPVLVVHGDKDRNAAYGGGREWALLWPDARLLTVENAAHAPWVERPEVVFGGIQTFLDGAWPEGARKVTAVDPKDEVV
jgi:pimeloyl-ACP methyl ester carboxylesterase